MVVDSCTTMVEYQGVDVDLSLASLFAGWALADELQRRLAADGFADVRFADGFVFQHLVEDPVTIGALADRLAVTQQAVSKSVADLERRGYVERRRRSGRRARPPRRAHARAATERSRRPACTAPRSPPSWPSGSGRGASRARDACCST